MEYKKVVYPNDPSLQNFIKYLTEYSTFDVFGRNNIAAPFSLDSAKPGNNASNNTGMGIDALDNLTDTSDNNNNSAYGFSAMLGAEPLTASSENVAVGCEAMGNISDGVNGSVAVGYQAGNNMKSYSVAVGYRAGYDSQGLYTVALGPSAGYKNQQNYAIAIGESAGYTGQGTEGIGIGLYAGGNTQGNYSVAIGSYAGNSMQSSGSVAIGRFAGQNSQGKLAVAIGQESGLNSQKNYAIAIGYRAGVTQSAQSVILNASGSTLNDGGNAGFFVNPVRASTVGGFCCYNTTSKEIGYTSAISITGPTGDTLYLNGGVQFQSTGTAFPRSTLNYYEELFQLQVSFTKNVPNTGDNNYATDTVRYFPFNFVRCGSVVTMTWQDSPNGFFSSLSAPCKFVSTPGAIPDRFLNIGIGRFTQLLTPVTLNNGGSNTNKIGLIDVTAPVTGDGIITLWPDFLNLPSTLWTGGSGDKIAGGTLSWIIRP